MKDKAPKRVVVIGGGTSGWLSAAYLFKKKARFYPLEIILIEASDIGVIGVGEATLPTLRRTLIDLDINEDEFFEATNGGFKLGVRFDNWLHDPAEKPGYYYHPFQKATGKDLVAAVHYLGMNPDAPPHAYGERATPEVLACDMNKAPKPFGAPDPDELYYAYHVDAILFGRYLRSKFEGKGIDRIEAKVMDVRYKEDGDLRAVVLEDGREVEGDLFIDCSGFQGLLINKHLKVPFTSYLEWLPCDRACAVQIPYRDGERFESFTRATAQKSGWIWDVTLTNRRGVGHVYSSKYTDKEQAEKDLLTYLKDPENTLGLKLRHLEMRAGRNDRLWERNCIAIGLAGGFLEPLESTGIYLVEQGIRLLDDNWPMDGHMEERRDNYNELIHRVYDECMFFVLMHYVTSQRKDSQFWRDITRPRPLPNKLDKRLALWRHKVPSANEQAGMLGSVFGFESYVSVLAGMGYFRGLPSNHAREDRGALERYLAKRQMEFASFVEKLPTHSEYVTAARARWQATSGAMS